MMKVKLPSFTQVVQTLQRVKPSSRAVVILYER